MDFDLDFVNPEPQAEGLDENEEGEGLDQSQRREKSKTCNHVIINLPCGRFKSTFEITQWRKVKQMQPV